MDLNQARQQQAGVLGTTSHPPNIGKEERDSAVLQQARVLADQLSRLEHLVDMMVSRLQPVLSQSPATQGGSTARDNAPLAGSSTIVTILAEVGSRVSAYSYRLEALLNSIEV